MFDFFVGIYFYKVIGFGCLVINFNDVGVIFDYLIDVGFDVVGCLVVFVVIKGVWCYV